jgi:lipopolysaccharide transport system permease protein
MQRKYFELIWLRGVGALKADAQNSYLGTLWWVLEPLLLTLLLYLAFSSGLRGEGDTSFAYFLICGMLPFKWTASSIASSAISITANKGLIGQTYLPKWVFPSICNVAMSIRFIIILPILMAAMIYGGYAPSINWLSLSHIVLCQLIFNYGISYLFAAATPLVPDIGHVVPLFITGLMFTSGIFFDVGTRSEDMQAILRLNPFVEVIEAYRTVLMSGEPVAPLELMYTWIVGITACISGLSILNIYDRYYPRVI